MDLMNLDLRVKQIEDEMQRWNDAGLAERLKPIWEELDEGNSRLDKIENRLDKIENRLDKIENRLDKVENRLDGIENRLDRIENRLDGIEEGMKDQREVLNLIAIKLGIIPN